MCKTFTPSRRLAGALQAPFRVCCRNSSWLEILSLMPKMKKKNMLYSNNVAKRPSDDQDQSQHQNTCICFPNRLAMSALFSATPAVGFYLQAL